MRISVGGEQAWLCGRLAKPTSGEVQMWGFSTAS